MNSSSETETSLIFFPTHLHFLHSHSPFPLPSSKPKTTEIESESHFGHFRILNVFPFAFFVFIPFFLLYSSSEPNPSNTQSGVFIFDILMNSPRNLHLNHTQNGQKKRILLEYFYPLIYQDNI